MRASLCLLAASLAAATAGAQEWAPLGPPGGDVRALAADPRDPAVVYLGTADGLLYRSDDAGRRWRRLTPGFPLRERSLDNILVDPRGRLLVAFWELHGPGGGVARSLDGGRNFELLSGMDGESVRALDVSAKDPDVLVAGSLSGVFRSDDGGDSWRRISPKGHAEIRNVESAAIDPQDPNVVYVGTWHLPWKTSDGGRSWRRINAGMIDDSDVFTMVLDRRTPRTLYASACSGIYRSSDAAAHWSKVRGIPASSRRTRAFAQDPARPDTLYAGTTEGFWISEDGASSWRLATPKGLVVNTIVAGPNGLLLGSEGAGVLRSVDAGRSFAPSNDGFSNHLISRILFDHTGSRVVAGVAGDRQHSGVLVAPRPEGPWTKLAEGLEGREVLQVALAGAEVLAGTDDGVFLSVSHCGSWRRLPTVVDGLDVHPRAADVAAVDERRLLAATDRGLLRSDDGGASWRRVGLGLATSVTALAVSPRDSSLAMATTALGVYLSRDAGASFEPVSRSLGQGEMRSLAFLPSDDRIVFAATRAGLLRSRDRGRSWERRGSGLPLSDIAGLAFHPDGRTLFAADFANGGLFRSTDAGDNWTRLETTGMATSRVYSLAVDPQAPERVFAGAASGGLHVLEAPSAPTPAGGR